MSLANNLKKIREERNLTKKELCEKTGISERAYLTYEFGEREPKISVVSKLADFYHVTTDYLLGREPKRSDPISDICDALGLNAQERAIITAYLSMDKKRRTELADIIREMAEKSQNAQQTSVNYVTMTTTLGKIEDELAEKEAKLKDGS